VVAISNDKRVVTFDADRKEDPLDETYVAN
jgi:hypothetical protein